MTRFQVAEVMNGGNKIAYIKTINGGDKVLCIEGSSGDDYNLM